MEDLKYEKYIDQNRASNPKFRTFKEKTGLSLADSRQLRKKESLKLDDGLRTKRPLISGATYGTRAAPHTVKAKTGKASKFSTEHPQLKNEY